MVYLLLNKLFQHLKGLLKKPTLTERTLKRFREHRPVSENVKGMFADETSETLKERFAKARKLV